MLDLAKQDYRVADQKASDEVAADPRDQGPEREVRQAARIGRSAGAVPAGPYLRDLFHYTAFHLADIADTARDVDFAIRWGYGWRLGPFETWQAAGWQQVAGWIAEDIAAGKAMSSAPLPAWVIDGRAGVHGKDGSYSASQNKALPRSSHPVYQRQHFPDAILGEKFDQGTTVFENDGLRLWHLGDDVGIVSFKTKMNTVNDAVLDGLQRAVDEAEQRFKGLVIWQSKEPFSAGADLKGAMGLLKEGKLAAFDAMIANFQATSMRLKTSLVPTVAAIRGMAFGGGCEFQMHCTKTVAALESYIGLVEAGVGLLPAGGGLKEIAVRCAKANPADPFNAVKTFFETVAMAKVSATRAGSEGNGSAARERHGRVQHARSALGRPARSRGARRCGLSPGTAGTSDPGLRRRVGTASLKMMLVNMLEGRFIARHDFEIGARIADTLCGGVVERGSLVDEQWLLDLERKHFVELAQMPKTQERIVHTLTDRQAAAQLSDEGIAMTKQIQDAYIVAATRTAGRRGAARRVPQHPSRRPARARDPQGRARMRSGHRREPHR